MLIQSECGYCHFALSISLLIFTLVLFVSLTYSCLLLPSWCLKGGLEWRGLKMSHQDFFLMAKITHTQKLPQKKREKEKPFLSLNVYSLTHVWRSLSSEAEFTSAHFPSSFLSFSSVLPRSAFQLLSVVCYLFIVRLYVTGLLCQSNVWTRLALVLMKGRENINKTLSGVLPAGAGCATAEEKADQRKGSKISYFLL